MSLPSPSGGQGGNVGALFRQREPTQCCSLFLGWRFNETTYPMLDLRRAPSCSSRNQCAPYIGIIIPRLPADASDALWRLDRNENLRPVIVPIPVAAMAVMLDEVVMLVMLIVPALVIV